MPNAPKRNIAFNPGPPMGGSNMELGEFYRCTEHGAPCPQRPMKTDPQSVCCAGSRSAKMKWLRSWLTLSVCRPRSLRAGITKKLRNCLKVALQDSACDASTLNLG